MNAPAKPFYNALITIESFEIKTNIRGNKYLVGRGAIAREGKDPIVRTFKAQGKALDAIRNEIKVGATVKLRGIYETVKNPDGSQGGQYFTVVKLGDLVISEKAYADAETASTEAAANVKTPANDPVSIAKNGGKLLTSMEIAMEKARREFRRKAA